MRNRLVFVFSLVVSLFQLASGQHTIKSIELQTYALLQEDMQLSLFKVAGDAVTVENRQLSKGSISLYPVIARLNPRGNQLAILSPKAGTSTSFYIVMYDLLTNSIIEIDERWIEPDSISWSNDGQYLIYARQSSQNYVDRLAANFDVMLFEVKTRKLTPIRQGVPYIPTMAWSHDGFRLAIGASVCYNERAQKECKLEVFDVRIPSGQSQTLNVLTLSSLKMSDRLPPAIGSDAGVICNLQWSPDDVYLSFRGGCGGTAVASVQTDVVLWSPSLSTLKIATPFSQSTQNGISKVQKNSQELFWEEWSDYQWYSATQVFISHWERTPAQNPPVISMRTFIFNLADKQLTSVGDVTADHWAMHPRNNWLGYRQTSNYDVVKPGLPAKDRTVTVVSVEGKTLKEIYRGSDGCGLEWSPTGETLFYVKRNLEGFDLNSPCAGGSATTGFEFVRFTDGKPSSTFVDVKSLGKNTIHFSLLGWVDSSVIGSTNP